MTMRRPATAAIVGLTLLTVGSAERSQAAGAADAPTFSEHVAPIVFANCSACHRPGEAAPFSLLSYDDVRVRGRLIASVTQSRQMPPWKAAPGDYPFRNARGLSDAEIDVLQRWVSAGMPEGDRSRLPAPPSFTPGWELGEPDLVVAMPEAFTVPSEGPDVYRNFVLPLNLDRDVWVRAVDFRPSARTVVHHSLFFLDATGNARRLDEGDPGPGYNGGMGGAAAGLSFGRGGLAALIGRGRGNATPAVARAEGGTLGGWALGARARELPEGLAFSVPRGSDLILSTHFHPSGRVEHEASTVGLYFAEAPPTQAFTGVQLPPVFGALEGLDIAPGDRAYTIADSFVLPIDVKGFGVGAHAHYLARDMKLTATLPGGDEKILLWITDWDFAWQEGYQFAGFVALPKGTRLDVRITYDNSADNPRNPSQPPTRVTWGEESTDEMGSMTLQLVAANPSELPLLQRAYAGHLVESVTDLGRGRRGRRR